MNANGRKISSRFTPTIITPPHQRGIGVFNQINGRVVTPSQATISAAQALAQPIVSGVVQPQASSQPQPPSQPQAAVVVQSVVEQPKPQSQADQVVEKIAIVEPALVVEETKVSDVAINDTSNAEVKVENKVDAQSSPPIKQVLAPRHFPVIPPRSITSTRPNYVVRRAPIKNTTLLPKPLTLVSTPQPVLASNDCDPLAPIGTPPADIKVVSPSLAPGVDQQANSPSTVKSQVQVGDQALPVVGVEVQAKQTSPLSVVSPVAELQAKQTSPVSVVSPVAEVVADHTSQPSVVSHVAELQAKQTSPASVVLPVAELQAKQTSPLSVVLPAVELQAKQTSPASVVSPCCRVARKRHRPYQLYPMLPSFKQNKHRPYQLYPMLPNASKTNIARISCIACCRSCGRSYITTISCITCCRVASKTNIARISC